MTLHLKSRGYPFRPRLLFSSFIVVGVGFPTVYYFRRGQISNFPRGYWRLAVSPPLATRHSLRKVGSCVLFRTFVSDCGRAMWS